MIRPYRFVFMVVAAALWTAGLPTRGEAQRIPHVVRDVVPGVFAIIRRPHPGTGSDSNVLVIENERDIIVVDANILPRSARENIALIKKRSRKPVSYVINTHWHSDHHYGNHEYRKAYPNVEFVQHANTRADIIARDMPALERNVTVEYPQVVARLRRALATGRTSRGDSVTPAMRTNFAASLGLYEAFLEDMAATPLVPGTLVVGDSLVIHRERRTIVVKYLGKGNTAGDLIVHLPEEKVVATGDLVVHPAPFAFFSHLREWPETLRRLRQIDARHIMPGHGEMLSDWQYVDALVPTIESVWTQVSAAVANGLTLDSTKKIVNIDSHRSRFSGATREMLDGVFLLPGVEAAYADLTSGAPRRDEQ